MKSALALALVWTIQLVQCQAQVDFQLRLSGSSATTATVAPGGTLALDVVAVSISAEVGIQANLDSFTYRVIFPDQLFTLNNNVFAAPFDNVLAPGGFNGSIPWTGLPLLITDNVDAGSPGATPLVPDLYRTTATTTGNSVTGPDAVLETLTLKVPSASGIYHISLNVLEAADHDGALHTTDNGKDFVLTVGGPCSPDTIPPVITLNGANPLTVECHTPFADPGATATDDCPVPGTVVAVSSSGVVDPNTPGNYTITYHATDASGNTATATRTVKVVDTTDPVITCPAAVTVTCLKNVPPALPFTGTVTDTCDPSPVVTHVGDVPVGTHPTIITRTYKATDASGNSATCTQKITVLGLVGDLNGDCCVDLTDLNLLLDKIRAGSVDPTFDLNGDGKVDIADARFLVLHFTNPGGAPCP